MTITFAPPHLVAPLNAEAVHMADSLASALTTIVGWGQYVDDEYGMTGDERALWRLLSITRDTMAEVRATAVAWDEATSRDDG